MIQTTYCVNNGHDSLKPKGEKRKRTESFGFQGFQKKENSNSKSAIRKRPAREPKKEEDVDYLWIKSLKLTIADERIYKLIDKNAKLERGNKYRRK